MIQDDIRKLVRYGVRTGLVPEEDMIFTTNRLLELFELSELEEEACSPEEEDLEQILGRMLDYAYEQGLIKENSVVYRDLFDTKIMDGHRNDPVILSCGMIDPAGIAFIFPAQKTFGIT